METVNILGVGMDVAVDMAGEVDATWFLSGFGMTTKAMLGGGGAAGFAQLENSRANAMTARQPLE